jgi:hypothetical protein
MPSPWVWRRSLRRAPCAGPGFVPRRRWLRMRPVRRRQAHGLAQADAEALIRDHGATAYSEARERERGSAEGEIARRPELVLVTTATGQRK